MLKPLSVRKRKHFLSGWAARHQLQVYKLISHFQALLLSHSGCVFFFFPLKQIELKWIIRPAYLKVKMNFWRGVFWRISATRQNILSLSCFLVGWVFVFFFNADSPAVNICASQTSQTQALWWVQKYLLVFRATVEGIWISFSLPVLLLHCCTVRLIEYLSVSDSSFNLVNYIANWA